MEKIISFFMIIIISSIMTYTNGQVLNYICNNAQSLYDASKNVNIPCTTCKKCDTGISPGFYYFSTYGRIPNFCPTINVCSAEATYWTDDAQPTASNPGPFNINLCLSLSETGNDADCNSSCSIIQTAFCSNLNVVVYELQPVPYCNVRYCFQELIPCGKNETSPTGFQPCQPAFPFNQLTNGTTGFASPMTDNLFSNIAGISAKCTIQCSANLDCSKLTGDVLWFSGSDASPFLNSSLLYDSNTNSIYGYAQESQWLPYINTFIRCNIIPRTDNQKSSVHLYTNPYYFGMFLGVQQPGSTYQILNFYDRKEITVTLSEASQNKAVLEVHSTIPILCKSGKASCTLNIAMTRESIYKNKDEDLVRVTNCDPNCGGCMKEIKNQIQEDPNNKAVWNIVTTVEAGNTNQGSTLKIQFGIKQSLQIFGNFWNNLLLPTVKLIYVPKNMAMNYYAYSYNDPHMKSFDGTYFEFQGYSDEYLMVENKDTLLRIHAIASNCNQFYWYWSSYVYCNDRLYIQSIDDLIIHDIRYGDMLYYKDLNSTETPMLINIAFDKDNNAMIPKPNVVQISRVDSRFRIITHFATIIYIDYYGNFEVYPSKLDYQRIWGLMGNYDKDASNDLNQIDGGTVPSVQDFFEAYRIKSPRPFMSKGEYYSIKNNQYNNVNTLTQYCMCTNVTGDFELKCPLGLTQLDSKVYVRSRSLNLLNNNNKISMKTLITINKKIQNFEAEKIFRKNEHEKKFNRLKRDIKDSCKETLNIPIFQTCENQGLINLAKIIENCELDFNLTQSDIWPSQYFQNTLTVCKIQLTQDKNTFETVQGVTQPQTEFLAKLCLNNCTNRGTCVLGVCNCNFPYTGEDCSIDRLTPANIYNSSMTNNVCDIQHNDSCTSLILFLDKITSEMNVTSTKYYQTEKDKFQQIDDQTTSNVISFSRNLIYANLSLPNQKANGFISVAFYNITVKDLSTSSPIFYAIYDSNCQTCNNPSDCFVNTGTCNIDSDCYKNGDQNPNNPNEICNHTNNQYKWSPKIQGLSVAGASSTPASPLPPSGLPPGTIAAIVVPIALVLVIAVVSGTVAFVIIKRRNGVKA